MSWPRVLRSVPALWVVPLVLAVLGLQLGEFTEPVDWGNALGPLILLTPCCATLCAHEAARQRIGEIRVARRWAVLRLAAPVALCVAAFAVTIALQTPGAVPPAGFMVNVVLLFVANAAIGLAAGRFGLAAAVPVGLLVSYGWIGAMVMADPGLKRSFTDALPCCSIDTQRTDPLPVNALLSLAVIAVAVAVATLPGPSATPPSAPPGPGLGAGPGRGSQPGSGSQLGPGPGLGPQPAPGLGPQPRTGVVADTDQPA